MMHTSGLSNRTTESLKNRLLKRQSNVVNTSLTSLKVVTLLLFATTLAYVLVYLEVIQVVRTGTPTFRCTCQCNSNKTTTKKNFPTAIGRKQTNYSVISASVPDFSNDTILIDENGRADNTNRAWGYLFLLPLTALTWQKIGFEVISVITVDYSKITPQANRLLRYVDKTLRQINVTVVYFDVPSKLKVRLGQILRLIPALLEPFNDDDFLITSDADLWPINPNGYQVPYGKTIQILNSECCGIFEFNHTDYRMFPLSHISMTAKMWRKLFKDDVKWETDISDEEQEKIVRIHRKLGKKLTVQSKHDMFYKYKHLKNFMTSLEKYAEGEDLYRPAKHDGKLWYLDQKYASIVINTYTRHVDNSSVDYVKGLTCKRLYTRDWNVLMNTSFPCVGDAHVHKDGPWNKERWGQLSMLTTRLFEKEILNFLDLYRDNFLNMFEERV